MNADFFSGLDSWALMVIAVMVAIAAWLKKDRASLWVWALFGAGLVAIAVMTYVITANMDGSVFSHPWIIVSSVVFLTIGGRFIGEWLTVDAKADAKKKESAEAQKSESSSSLQNNWKQCTTEQGEAYWVRYISDAVSFRAYPSRGYVTADGVDGRISIAGSWEDQIERDRISNVIGSIYADLSEKVMVR
ncbi:hypothetical protein [Enterovibrio sp. 27052020O]|uniref:hypothetical protein n=1 Tax=Enterovibrio sp. 27052020O TaxID=3241166 RepID=UPI00388D2C89